MRFDLICAHIINDILGYVNRRLKQAYWRWLVVLCHWPSVYHWSCFILNPENKLTDIRNSTLQLLPPPPQGKQAAAELKCCKEIYLCKYFRRYWRSYQPLRLRQTSSSYAVECQKITWLLMIILGYGGRRLAQIYNSSHFPFFFSVFRVAWKLYLWIPGDSHIGVSFQILPDTSKCGHKM